jgi:predicted Zn-dependent protease
MLPSRLLAPALLLVLLAGCASTTQTGATGINRRQFMLLSSDQVNTLSLQSYQAELGSGRQKGILNADKVMLERIRRIADRLIPQTAVFRPDAPGWAWEVNLETSDEINAYCAPGGKIMVYSGLIKKLNLSDDEIAAVMGHEISHALREHGRERMSQAYAEQVSLSLAGVLLGATDQQAALAQSVVQVAIALPHSRGQESEADVLGLELAARAGYDPRAAITLWDKMDQIAGSSGPAFLSTHPASPDRRRNLQARLPQVLPLYEAAKRNGALNPRPVVPRT